jgi:hypothetical protein
MESTSFVGERLRHWLGRNVGTSSLTAVKKAQSGLPKRHRRPARMARRGLAGKPRGVKRKSFVNKCFLHRSRLPTAAVGTDFAWTERLDGVCHFEQAAEKNGLSPCGA